MSVETLRAAAEGMRGEYETNPFRLGQTMLAVADWLDAEACISVSADYDWTLDPARVAALTVARAYLGESA